MHSVGMLARFFCQRSGKSLTNTTNLVVRLRECETCGIVHVLDSKHPKYQNSSHFSRLSLLGLTLQMTNASQRDSFIQCVSVFFLVKSCQVSGT